MDAQLRLIPRPATPSDEAPTRRRRTGAPRPAPASEATEAPAHWRIDDSARERGRAGISRAREALRNARRPLPTDPHPGSHTTAA